MLFLLLVLSTSFILASNCPYPPGLPKTYLGTLRYNGVQLSGNYPLTAMIGSDIVGTSNVINGLYSIDISPCTISTGQVSFSINGVPTNEYGIYNGQYDWGNIINLNLTVNQNPPLTSTCGNGNIELGEECDGSNFGAATCGNGYTGTLSCTSQCKIDRSNCALIQSNSGGSSGGSSGGNSGGGGGGGVVRGGPSSEISTAMPLNSAIPTSISNESTNNIDLTGNNIPPGTGLSILDFAKSGAGLTIEGLFIVLLLVIGVIVLKKKSPKNEQL